MARQVSVPPDQVQLLIGIDRETTIGGDERCQLRSALNDRPEHRDVPQIQSHRVVGKTRLNQRFVDCDGTVQGGPGRSPDSFLKTNGLLLVTAAKP